MIRLPEIEIPWVKALGNNDQTPSDRRSFFIRLRELEARHRRCTRRDLHSDGSKPDMIGIQDKCMAIPQKSMGCTTIYRRQDEKRFFSSYRF